MSARRGLTNHLPPPSRVSMTPHKVCSLLWHFHLRIVEGLFRDGRRTSRGSPLKGRLMGRAHGHGSCPSGVPFELTSSFHSGATVRLPGYLPGYQKLLTQSENEHLFSSSFVYILQMQMTQPQRKHVTSKCMLRCCALCEVSPRPPQHYSSLQKRALLH